MLIYTYSKDKDKVEAALCAALGVEKGRDPSWPLPNMKEVADHDYWNYLFTWTIETDAFVGSLRGVDVPKGRLCIQFVDHGTLAAGGFAVLFGYWGKDEGRPSVRYFTWRACDHKFQQKTLGNCYNRYTCEKCGRYYDVDSSD
jgi:hypothetical protein